MANKKKTKRIKMETYQTDDQIEIKRFVKILVAVLIAVLGVYFFTRMFVTKDLLNDKVEIKETIAGKINYEITNISSMLNKKENEYYVIMYNSEDLNAVYYSTLASKYSQKENALKIYYADLDNQLNKKFISSNIDNLNPKDINDFRVSNLALVKIKDNKIEKAYSAESDIANELAEK